MRAFQKLILVWHYHILRHGKVLQMECGQYKAVQMGGRGDKAISKATTVRGTKILPRG